MHHDAARRNERELSIEHQTVRTEWPRTARGLERRRALQGIDVQARDAHSCVGTMGTPLGYDSRRVSRRFRDEVLGYDGDQSVGVRDRRAPPEGRPAHARWCPVLVHVHAIAAHLPRGVKRAGPPRPRGCRAADVGGPREVVARPGVATAAGPDVHAPRGARAVDGDVPDVRAVVFEHVERDGGSLPAHCGSMAAHARTADAPRDFGPPTSVQHRHGRAVVVPERRQSCRAVFRDGVRVYIGAFGSLAAGSGRLAGQLGDCSKTRGYTRDGREGKRAVLQALRTPSPGEEVLARVHPRGDPAAEVRRAQQRQRRASGDQRAHARRVSKDFIIGERHKVRRVWGSEIGRGERGSLRGVAQCPPAPCGLAPVTPFAVYERGSYPRRPPFAGEVAFGAVSEEAVRPEE